MFYIRKNSSSKKRLEEKLTLAQGLSNIKKYICSVSLMYKLPNARGIKILSNEDIGVSSLVAEGYPTKKSKNTLMQDKDILLIYSRLDEIELDFEFEEVLIIKTSKGDEMMRISDKSVLNKIIKDITIPLKKILNMNLSQESNIPSESSEQDLLSNDIIYLEDNSNLLEDPECTSIAFKDVDSHEELSILGVTSGVKDGSAEKKISSNNKYVKYYIAGTLRSGTQVKLSEYIYDYKKTLAAYEIAKEKYKDDFTAISIRGYRQDGSLGTRFTKKYSPNFLSFEYISEFIRNFSKQAEFLSLIEEDVKNVLATEDKKYNVAHHILTATDLDFESEHIQQLLLDMKISADKRRDMKDLFKLLTVIKPLIDISPKLSESVELAIENINKSSSEGRLLYKDKNICDFVKEVDIECAEALHTDNSKIRNRLCAIENTVSIYKKHYS